MRESVFGKKGVFHCYMQVRLISRRICKGDPRKVETPYEKTTMATPMMTYFRTEKGRCLASKKRTNFVRSTKNFSNPI